MSINSVVDRINKRFGNGTIMKMGEVKWLVLNKVSTGIFALDVELLGGMPQGRMIEIYGKEDSCKTSMALLIAANYQRKGYEVGWIDAEGAYDSKWCKKLGVDESKLELSQPEYGEKIVDIIDAMVRSGEFGLVVLDSIAATSPMVEQESSAENQQMGVSARLINKMIRKLHSALNTRRPGGKPNMTTVILINQLRATIGPYQNPETTPGGMGKNFGCSLRLKLKRGDYLKYGKGDKEIVLGQGVKFYVEKSKVSPVRARGSFDFYTRDFEPANSRAGKVDNISTVIKYGIIFDMIEQAGGWFKINGKRIQGEDSLKLYLVSRPKLLKKIRKQIMKQLKQEKKTSLKDKLKKLD